MYIQCTCKNLCVCACVCVCVCVCTCVCAYLRPNTGNANKKLVEVFEDMAQEQGIGMPRVKSQSFVCTHPLSLTLSPSLTAFSHPLSLSLLPLSLIPPPPPSLSEPPHRTISQSSEGIGENTLSTQSCWQCSSLHIHRPLCSSESHNTI